jgi:outer membrane protein assembly factor BamB
MKKTFCFLLFLPALLWGQTGSVTPAMPVGASPVWSRGLGGEVLEKPFLQAESVVVASAAAGTIRSFYMTGSALWNYDSDVTISPHVARSMEGASYISDSRGYFRAINRIGRELWRVNLGRMISFSPVVGWDGRVFIPVESMISCRTAAGNSLWTIDLESPMVLPPKLDYSGGFVTVLENHDLVRVSHFSSVERLKLDQVPLTIVFLKAGNLGSSPGNSYVLLYPDGDMEKVIFNEGAARGNRLSRSSLPSLPAPPAAAASFENMFAVTLTDGRVLLLNDSAGILWTGNSHETAEEKGAGNLSHTEAGMVFDERGIYSTSTRGTTGFALDGRRRLILKFEEASSVPAFSDEGILYVCGTDRILYAYMLDRKPRTIARSKYYGPEPPGSYGLGNPPPSPWLTEPNRFDETRQNEHFRTIERAINSGQVGENESAYVAYLMEMIGFFLNDPHYSRVRPAVSPIRHVELIRLLGRIGSRETIPFLYNIFDRYHEPSVKSACAEAIGAIGVDPYGNTFESYNFLLAANNPNRDPQLLLSATSSIAALCRFSGPPLSGDGILLLRHFSNLSWAPSAVRNQIRMELDALYREGLDMVIR